MNSLSGKTALITGGATGIGFAIADRLARDGADIVIMDVSSDLATAAADRLTKEWGIRAVASVADISDEAQVESAMEKLMKASLTPDILVNNAGIMAPRLVALEDITTNEFDAMVAVHLRGTYLVSRIAIPTMKAKRSGRIINLSSVLGLIGMPRRSVYSLVKAGIIGLTRALAIETARSGITVNAVAPGYILTETLSRRVSQGLIDHDRLADRTPVGRWGKPEEVAHLIGFLAHPASAYITGTIISVDGGLAIRGDANETLED